MINWGALLVEFVVALVAAVGTITLYSIGLRLLAIGAGEPGASATSRPAGATIGAWLCFAIDIAAVLFGLYLLIPQLHG